jgi:hypothetical protein
LSAGLRGKDAAVMRHAEMGGPHQAVDPLLARALGALRYGLYFLSVGTPEASQSLLFFLGKSDQRSTTAVAGRGVPQSLRAVPTGAEGVALNLLSASDHELLARSASARFAGLELAAGTLGLPVLVQGLGTLCCRVREGWRPGDHALFLGQAEGVLWRGGVPGGNVFLDAGATGHAYLGLA